MQIRMQIGMQQRQRQKVSDTEQRIENRLVELHRSMVEVQSPESNPVGNSDGRYAPEGNTSSVIDGLTISRAQSVASSSAKVRRRIHMAMGKPRKMSKIAKIITGEKEKSHRWRQKHRKMAEKVLKHKTFS